MQNFTVWYIGTSPRYRFRAESRHDALLQFAAGEKLTKPNVYMQARKSKPGEILTDYASGYFITV